MKTENITISNNDKLTFISNLSTLLSAGIPLLETVDSLLEDSKGNLRKLLEALRNDLIQGQHMYVTFSKFPRVFDRVNVSILKASEEAGTLDVVLKDLQQNIIKEREFTDKVKSALIYPIFIMVVFFGVLLMILIVVVPKISTVFSRLKTELPLPTKILIFMSETLLNNTIPVVICFILLAASITVLYKKKRHLLIGVLIALPLISKLAQQIDLTRFARSLHLLLNSGIPITSAIELTENVVMKKDVKQAISHTKEVVTAGRKLSEGFKDGKKIFSGIMVRIAEAGERSGSLEKSMQEISEFMDYQVSGTLKTITALIEPILLVVVGVFIGGMMLAIIAPIYGLIGQIGSR